jgi:hypothetical protein
MKQLIAIYVLLQETIHYTFPLSLLKSLSILRWSSFFGVGCLQEEEAMIQGVAMVLITYTNCHDLYVCTFSDCPVLLWCYCTGGKAKIICKGRCDCENIRIGFNELVRYLNETEIGSDPRRACISSQLARFLNLTSRGGIPPSKSRPYHRCSWPPSASKRE